MSGAGRQMPARILSVLLFSDSLTTAAAAFAGELHRGDHVRIEVSAASTTMPTMPWLIPRRPASTTTEFTAATLGDHQRHCGAGTGQALREACGMVSRLRASR